MRELLVAPFVHLNYPRLCPARYNCRNGGYKLRSADRLETEILDSEVIRIAASPHWPQLVRLMVACQTKELQGPAAVERRHIDNRGGEEAAVG